MRKLNPSELKEINGGNSARNISGCHDGDRVHIECIIDLIDDDIHPAYDYDYGHNSIDGAAGR